MKYVGIGLLLLLLFTLYTPAYAAEPCGKVDRTDYDVGKSTVSFEATASDGCHVVHWTNVQGQDGTSGMVTFTTKRNAQAWELGLQPTNWCAYQAAHEANLYMTNIFAVESGVQVTVSYSCT